MRLRLTYANTAATLALVIAVAGAGGGEAIASAVKKLAPNTVTTKAIKNGAVTGAKIKDRSITEYDIARGRIGGAEIKDGSLGGIDIADGSLGGADIADGSLGGQDIAPGSIGGYNLAAGTIGSREIADGSISSADISDGTIGDRDLAPGAITSDNIGPNTIRGTNIAPQTIGIGKLDPSAIVGIANRWDGGPITAGSKVTGYSAIGYVDANPAGNGDPDVRALPVSFPARVTGILDVLTVNLGQGAPAQCAGTFAAPAAAPGYACVYVRPDSANNPGVFAKLDQSDYGFALKYTPPTGGGWTFAQISWAFTRPAD